jgi:hypothetical protein
VRAQQQTAFSHIFTIPGLQISKASNDTPCATSSP